MNCVYVIINGVDYLMPFAVLSKNKRLIISYLKNNNGKIYFDIDKFIIENDSKVIQKIYRECISSVGMNALDIEDDYLAYFNKLNSYLTICDKEIDYYFKKGNNKNGYRKILLGLKMVLEFYNKMILEVNS